MGSKSSKGEGEEEEKEDHVFNRQKIYWDAQGNLRHDENRILIDKAAQMRSIIELDHVDDQDEGTLCYIMDSAWISSWLAFIHFDKENSPDPGPCDNTRLLTYDYHEHQWVGRFGLLMATSNSGGDYRRVSEPCWNKFKEYYPGSGPTITMIYNPKEKKTDGNYDVSLWKIIDPPAKPADDDETKKKKKRSLFQRNKPIMVEEQKQQDANQIVPNNMTADVKVNGAMESKDNKEDYDTDDDDYIVPSTVQQEYKPLSPNSENINTTSSPKAASDKTKKGYSEAEISLLKAPADERDSYYEQMFFKKE